MSVNNPLNYQTNTQPIPTVYNEGFSQYEAISKLIQVVNDLITNGNANIEQTQGLKTLVESLQSLVSTNLSDDVIALLNDFKINYPGLIDQALNDISSLNLSVNSLNSNVDIINDKVNSVSILEYKNYATKVNNVITDWKPAIVKALSDMSTNVVSSKTLFLPSGVYPIIQLINLSSVNNGITICGEGYSSIIKIADGSTQNWMFSLNDSTTPLEGITIKNLQLHGNKSNTGNSGTTGFGIYVQQPAGQDNKNIIIENVWAHDFLTSGFNIFSSNVILNNVYSWNNGLHGIGVDIGKNIIIDNANCYNNSGYGIDWHGGQGIVNNVICVGNTLGGMKTSNGATIYLTLTNAKLNNNGGEGFTTTNSNGSTYFFDNIEVIGNVKRGFRLSEGLFANIGKIFALGNNTLNEVGSGQVSINVPATVDSIVIQGGNGYGLISDNGSRIDINKVNIQNCGSYGIYGYGINATINSGRVINNCTNSGNIGIFITGSGLLNVKNVEIGDTNVTKKQTRGIYVDANCIAIIISCDLRNNSSAPIYDNGSTTLITKSNLGYINEKCGTKTSSGDGSGLTYYIPHGLSSTPNYVSVVPTNTLSRNNINNITCDSVNINISYSSPPPVGTNNLQWYWEAKYNK